MADGSFEIQSRLRKGVGNEKAVGRRHSKGSTEVQSDNCNPYRRDKEAEK